MAENEASMKEEQNSKDEEKEEDTKVIQGEVSTPSKKQKEKISKKAKGSKSKEEVPKPDEEGGEVDPNTLVPLFLSSKTQEMFKCLADQDVTEESPNKLIPKEAIVQDMKDRAAVSDFHPVKQIVLAYPGEELLLIYDPDFTMGQNFIFVSTEESKQKITKPPSAKGEEGVTGDVSPEGEEEEIDPSIYCYVPPEPKEWVSLGSEVEIEESAVHEKDPQDKIHITVKRLRREFGAPTKFCDRNADDVKDGYIECLSYEDKNYNLKVMELEMAVQAIGTYCDIGTQTDWKHPCNKSCQYEPREFTSEEKKNMENSEKLVEFIEGVTPRFELALQQNEIIDVFMDDWKALGTDDDTFGSKSDNHLKEYQSFTDLQFSRSKVLTGIEWHPTIKGVIAVSCSEHMTFDDRIDHSSKIIMSPSLILIWSFADPIHPQILLEAPDDIFCFKFNPTDPNIIAGGCLNGQVVMWDITKYADRLRSSQRGKQVKKNAMMNLPGFEDENTDKTPVIRYCAVSAIEQSHKTAVEDLQWLPDHMEISRFGIILENRVQQCCQILTASTDGTIAIWDTRPPKGQNANNEDNKNDGPLGVASTFKHLDLTWKPVIKIPINKVEGNGDYSPSRVSFQERQGNRTLLKQPDGGNSGGLERKESSLGGFGLGTRSGSAKEKKPLEGATTKFYVGTEDGELVYADLKLEKDPDSGKLVPPKPDYCKMFHTRKINTLQRSPFFKDILLVVGGWKFSIWKEGMESGPLLQSAASPRQLTAAFWSPTRPSVFYIGTAEGNVDVWDLLDRTHEPSLTQNISASSITYIYPWSVSLKQQLVAVSDSVGTLHILEIPWTLRNISPGELNSFTAYLDREHRRLEYHNKRKDFHVENKKRMDAEEAQKKMAKPPEPNEDEIENKMRAEWLDFKEDENKFLIDLGLTQEKEEPLPDL